MEDLTLPESVRVILERMDTNAFGYDFDEDCGMLSDNDLGILAGVLRDRCIKRYGQNSGKSPWLGTASASDA